MEDKFGVSLKCQHKMYVYGSTISPVDKYSKDLRKQVLKYILVSDIYSIIIHNSPKVATTHVYQQISGKIKYSMLLLNIIHILYMYIYLKTTMLNERQIQKN